MTYAQQRLWSLGLGLSTAAGVASLVACSSMDAAFADSRAGEPSGSFPDAGSAPSAGDDSDLGPTDNGVILVHAAGAPSFRLCFANDLDRLPTPDSELMPAANVVGVEVGSAVRIPPLNGAPGEVYLYSEPLIRSLYLPGSPGPTCKELIDDPAQSVVPLVLGKIDKSLATGVHLLVVSGCAKKTPVKSYTKEQCGESYDESTGNLKVSTIELTGRTRKSNSELPAQVVHLSQPLESFRGQRSLKVTFGDVDAGDAGHTVAAENPPLGGPPTDFASPPTFDPSDVGVYASRGFRITVDDAILAEQTMAEVQVLSAPREVPPTYYAVASNYVLLLLGDPAPKLDDGGLDPSERRNLHLLAVPVIQPREADGGAQEPGTSTDADGGS